MPLWWQSSHLGNLKYYGGHLLLLLPNRINQGSPCLALEPRLCGLLVPFQIFPLLQYAPRDNQSSPSRRVGGHRDTCQGVWKCAYQWVLGAWEMEIRQWEGRKFRKTCRRGGRHKEPHVDTSRVWYQGGKFHFSPSFELFSVMTENRKQKGGPLLWTRRVQSGWGAAWSF